MSSYPDFAALLEHHLQQTDRSAAWLGRRLQVDSSTVAKWRGGDSRPKDPETVIRIADALGIHAPGDRQALLRAAGYAYIDPPTQAAPAVLPSQVTDTTPPWPNADTVETILPIARNDPPQALTPPLAELRHNPARQVQWSNLYPQSRLWLAAIYKRAALQRKHAWCLLGLFDAGLMVGLSYPLLWEWPLARLWIMSAVVLIALILLMVDFYRRHAVVSWLVRLTSGSRLAKMGTVSLLFFSLMAWFGIGLPRLLGQWPYSSREEDGDHYGYALTSGDYNGDGYTDLAIGAPGKRTVYKFGGHAGWGFTLNGASYNMTSAANFGQAGLDFNRDGDRFGWAMATGDFNGDGIADLAIGAPGKTIGNAVATGCVYVFKGSPRGLVPWQIIDQHLLGANETGDQFGWSLAVGDFNHDNKDDLAIGAPYEQPGADPRSGYVFIFTGGVNNFKQWFGLQQAGITQPQEGARFGWALAAGDFDHDGRADLAVGAPGALVGQGAANANTGHVYIFRSIAGQAPDFWQDLVAPPSLAPLGNRFGTALLTADLNNDGWLDLAVGAPGEPPEAQPTVPVPGYVALFQNQQQSFAFWQGLDQTGLAPNHNFDLFGWSLATGDFNRDGRPDLAVGAPGKLIITDNGKRKSGAVFTFENKLAANKTNLLAPWQNFTEPELDREQFNDHFGWSLATGNFDHDGSADLAVGAPGGVPTLHWVSGLVYSYRTTVGGLALWLWFYQTQQ